MNKPRLFPVRDRKNRCSFIRTSVDKRDQIQRFDMGTYFSLLYNVTMLWEGHPENKTLNYHLILEKNWPFNEIKRRNIRR
jgi:hypothetical protein